MALYAIDKDGNRIKVAGAVPGPPGAQGNPGASGPPGPGVPDGGDAEQVLVKKTDANQDTQWKTLTAADVGAVSGSNISAMQGLTQAEFDALTAKEPNTLYVVTED